MDEIFATGCLATSSSDIHVFVVPDFPFYYTSILCSMT